MAEQTSTEKLEPAEASRPAFNKILFYFASLYLIGGATGISGIPINFLLKNDLKLSASQSALYHLIVAIPLYFAFLFGFIRDRWSPLGLRDRGYLIVFGPLVGLSYLSLAYGHVTYERLVIGMLGVTLFYRFISSAIQGLTSAVGQERWMTGRLSALFNFVANLLGAATSVIGGVIEGRVSVPLILAGLGVLMFAFVVLGIWHPRAVFKGHPEQAAGGGSSLKEIGRLLANRALWPAALIWLMTSFCPASGVPVLYYLTDKLHMSSSEYGLYASIVIVSFIPPVLLYGWLCQRYSLWTLLLWATVLEIPQYACVLLYRSPHQALLFAPLIGLLGGLASAAYIDLLLRACPKGLEGTGMMIADTAFYIAIRFSELFGASAYQRGGFVLPVIWTVVIYALILPVLWLVPRGIVAHKDGKLAAGPS